MSYHYGYDALGRLKRVEKDGEILRTYQYDAYGNRVSLRGSYGYDEFGQDLYGNQGQAQPFGYTGYQPERIAGTYYAQAREYVPSVGKFASQDLDRYMRIQDPNSINLYNYCVSNPLRYVDPSGNNLEEVLNEQFPSTVEHSDNDAVQVDISKNNIKIDIYVQFTGEVDLTTANGTPCKDLAIAGMESWTGPYMDVFGEGRFHQSKCLEEERGKE